MIRVHGLVLGFFLGGIFGCGGGAPGQARTLTILDPNFEAIFNPSWDMPAKFTLFEPLVGLDEHGEVEPRLARRWERSADARTWTYHLRTDVRWHDGVPVTAHDVAFTMQLLSHPKILYYGRLDTLIVHDDSTLTIRTVRPFIGTDWWTVYYPRHLLDTLDAARFFEWEFWERPVGNGPFRYVRHEPRTMWEMEANPDYYRGRPRLDRLVVKFGGGAPTVELRSGRVDALTYLGRSELPALRDDDRFEVYHALVPDAGWVEGVIWNHRTPYFADRRVRRALTMAIDRVELMRMLNLPDDLPVFDVLFTGGQFRRRELPEPIPFDPAAAARLLAEAGWSDGDGDGVRERNGQPFRFTALVQSGGASATSAWDRAAVYIQESLRRVGVRMEIQTMQAGVLQRLRAGDFAAAVNRFFQPQAADWFGEASPIGYHDPEVAALLAALRTAVDPEEQDRLMRELMPLIARDVPITFFAPNVQHFATHRRVRGLSSPYRADPLAHAEHVWLESRP